MNPFSHVQRCHQLTDGDLSVAMQSRDTCRALLEHLAAISKPNDGGAKLLILFARLATSECSWIDGDMRIEMVGDGEVSVVEIMTELGGGMRERLFPPFVMNVPLAEFSRAVERVPHMTDPLAIHSKTEHRVVFTVDAEARRSTSPPPSVRIAEDSLFRIPAAAKLPGGT